MTKCLTKIRANHYSDLVMNSKIPNRVENIRSIALFIHISETWIEWPSLKIFCMNIASGFSLSADSESRHRVTSSEQNGVSTWRSNCLFTITAV